MKKYVDCIKCGIPIGSIDFIDNNSRYFSINFKCNHCNKHNTYDLSRGVVELDV